MQRQIYPLTQRGGNHRGNDHFMHRGCGWFLITGVGEVYSCNRACLDGDGFHDWSEALVPGLERVCSGRDFVDLERAHRIADSEIRVRHNADVRSEEHTS